MPLVLYLERVQGAIAPTTFWVGIIKAPVFGLLCALRHLPRPCRYVISSRARPPHHRRRLVQSIFLVIFANAMFAIAFWRLDI